MRRYYKSMLFSIFLTIPSLAQPHARYYHPAADERIRYRHDDIEVTSPMETGGTVEVFDHALARAGIPAKMKIDCDENQEKCYYQIIYRKFRYNFTQTTNNFSIHMNAHIKLFIFNDDIYDIKNKNYNFELVNFYKKSAKRRACYIAQGNRLGILRAKNGEGRPERLAKFIDKLALFLADGRISAKDYHCGAATPIDPADQPPSGVTH